MFQMELLTELAVHYTTRRSYKEKVTHALIEFDEPNVGKETRKEWKNRNINPKLTPIGTVRKTIKKKVEVALCIRYIGVKFPLYQPKL